MKTIEQVSEYIERRYPSRSVKYIVKLSGGYVNHVYRVVFNNLSTLILKHFSTELSSNSFVPIGQERYFVEKKALNLFSHTPRLYYADDSLYTLEMEDIGESVMSFLDLLRNPIDNNIQSIISELLLFLEEIKGTKADDVFRNPSAFDILNNYVVPQYSETLSKFRIPSPPEVSATPFNISEGDVVTFGDLWPNSIFISPDFKSFWLLDWEMCRLAPNHSDVIQLLSNLWIMSHSSEFHQPSVLLCYNFIVSAYSELYADFYTLSKKEIFISVVRLIDFPHWKLSDPEKVLNGAISQFI